MMLWQGARAFEIWTGKEMPVEHIKSILFWDGRDEKSICPNGSWALS